MASNVTPMKEAAATAKFPIARRTPDEIVSETRKRAEVVKKHPEFEDHPDLRASVETWVASAEALDRDAQRIKELRLTLTALLATQSKDIEAWKRPTKRLIGIINDISEGSPEAIKQWGFDVVTRAVSPASTAAPTGLRAQLKGRTLQIRWNFVPGNRGYFVQRGDGTPQGWGQPIPTPRAMFSPDDLAPGQSITVRVAVQRKNGLSEWSDALTAVAR